MKIQGFGKRLEAAILAAGLKKAEFCRRIEIAPAQLGPYLSGEMLPRPELMVRMAHVLSVTVDFLMTGRELRLPLIAEGLPTYKKTKPRMIPVLTWVQAGALASAVDPYPYKGAAEEYVAVAVQGEQCIALRVRGDSMIPEFRPGDVIIVDTEQRDAQSGDYIVVKDDASEEATFKQFMKTVEGLRLRPINLVKHGEIVFSPDHRIVGKVVRLIRSY